MSRFPPRQTVAALTLYWLSMTAVAQDHSVRARASEPPSPSPLSIPLDAETRAALPRIKVAAAADGKMLDCEGVGLSDLLRKADGLPAELRGPALASYVLVTARDGSRVVYSLAELDPSLGKQQVVLADQCEGQALTDEEGPLRLIAPDELHSARWVRQVQSITVIRAP